MILKSIFDRVFALLGLVILSPILALVGFIIKISMSDGSIIFSQKRVGKNGEIFTMYKFRTMHAKHDGSSVSVKGQQRITPIGAILRKYKLDELPELWNVLKGDMSLVGPRPDVPGFADQLQEVDKIILSVKPGITGPASLKYKNEEELLSMQEDPEEYNNEVIWPDKIHINKNYIKEYSFTKDLYYIYKTLVS